MTKRKTKSTAQDGYINLAARIGQGADNLATQGQYTQTNMTRNRQQLEAAYRTSWVVGAAVDAIAEDMTREGVAIQGEVDPGRIDWLQTRLTRLGIWRDLLSLIKWARLYGGAVAVINIDGQKYDTPLRLDTVGKKQFSGLRVYDRWQVVPRMTEFDPATGLPVWYDILPMVSDNLAGAGPGQTAGQVTVHHSRLIRQIGIQLPAWQALAELYWGESIIERMQDRLQAFDEATGGAANLLHHAYLRVVGVQDLRTNLAAGGSDFENSLLSQFRAMGLSQSAAGVTILDSTDVFNTHSYSFAGVGDLILQFGQQIAGATGIPLVRLFGQSPAGLNSTGESDLRMYYDNISALQESTLRDGVWKILQVLYRSEFGEVPPNDLDFDFVPLWQMSAREQAEVAAIRTNAIIAAYSAGLLSEGIVLRELKQGADENGLFSNITDDDITDADADSLPPAPVPGARAAIAPEVAAGAPGVAAGVPEIAVRAADSGFARLLRLLGR